MKYVNVNTVLPETLIAEIQKYVQGETIYIPKKENTHSTWGSRSGARKLLDERNKAIKEAFHNGLSIQELADEHFLSVESIKKIVYRK
jgi:DNA-binding NarL/FixJ family response regulator